MHRLTVMVREHKIHPSWGSSTKQLVSSLQNLNVKKGKVSFFILEEMTKHSTWKLCVMWRRMVLSGPLCRTGNSDNPLIVIITGYSGDKSRFRVVYRENNTRLINNNIRINSVFCVLPSINILCSTVYIFTLEESGFSLFWFLENRM